jgi:mycothiol synthase
MAMARVRRYRETDIESVLAVRNEGLSGEPSVTRAGLEGYWRQGSVRPERDVWVVEHEGELVAYGCMRQWHSADWRQAEIVVRPEWRSRGAGQALLGRLVDVARGQGIAHLGAVASDEEPAAGEFLRDQGFELYVARQHMRLQPPVVAEVPPVLGYVTRLATSADCPALADVSNAAYAADGRMSPADAVGYRLYLERSGARVWMAVRERDGAVGGLCEVRARTISLGGQDVESRHISSLAVHPAFQRLGLGRWLLAHSIRMCAEAGWPTVELNVDRDNEPALALYTSLGFGPVYRFSIYHHAI